MFKTYFHNHCVFEGFPNPMVKTLRWYMFNWGGGGGDCFGMLALGGDLGLGGWVARANSSNSVW